MNTRVNREALFLRCSVNEGHDLGAGARGVGTEAAVRVAVGNALGDRPVYGHGIGRVSAVGIDVGKAQLFAAAGAYSVFKAVLQRGDEIRADGIAAVIPIILSLLRASSVIVSPNTS